jgi:TRAP-type mannitol/chloroaromatic compound transport system permease small subunit
MESGFARRRAPRNDGAASRRVALTPARRLSMLRVGESMRGWLRLSGAIDRLNESIGGVCNWLVLAACLVSAANAMIRYAFSYSSNGYLEAQWYMFAVLVMFGASYTFKRNEHVRVEIFYVMLSERGQLWLDLIGTLCFLIPSCLLLSYLSVPFFIDSYDTLEMSGNAGGLVRWPIKAVLPVGFAMLALQGVSEVIKRVAALKGELALEVKYERPTQ